MKNDKPIFETILGAKWQSLPVALKRHYNIRAFNNDIITVKGTITVEANGMMKWLAPLLGVMGVLPPFAEKDIPITVIFASDPISSAFHFNRMFQYRQHAPYAFNSKMIPVGANELVDLTRCNMGWRMAYDFDGNQITLKHRAFVFKFFKWFIPLPIEWLIGSCNSYEERFQKIVLKWPWNLSIPGLGCCMPTMEILLLMIKKEIVAAI